MAPQRPITTFLLTVLALLSVFSRYGGVRADEHSHKYAPGEEIVVWGSTAGPLHNAAEIYPLFSLPYCRGPAITHHRHETLGEALMGLALENVGVPLQFGVDANSPVGRSGGVTFPRDAVLCNATLDAVATARFAAAVRANYRLELLVDDLPVWGWVGQVGSTLPEDPFAAGEHVSGDDEDTERPLDDTGGSDERKRKRSANAIPSTGTATKNATPKKPADPIAVYTHWAFSFSTNQNQIIHVNLTMGNPVVIPEGAGAALGPTAFTYSATFTPTTIPFHARFDRYLDSAFFEHTVHWLAILNSFVLFVVLVVCVTVIMYRALRRDYARYDQMDIFDLDRDFDDFGWKQLHGDVFRAPPNLGVFAAYLGSGVQLLSLAIVALLYSAADEAYQEQAGTLTVSIFVYALASFLNGYVAIGYYCKYGGQRWIRQALLAAAVVPVVSGGVIFAVNLLAIMYGSARAIPLGSMVALIAIYMTLVVPLTVLGGALGKRFLGGPPAIPVYAMTTPGMPRAASMHLLAGMTAPAVTVSGAGFPCRVNPIPRLIPHHAWHTHPAFLITAGGLLPFMSAYVEFYYVLASAAGLKVYYMYGMLFAACGLLVSTVACCGVVVAYWLVNAEDHRWHWVTFYASGSSAVYMFLYSAYFYYFKTQMHGLFQFAFYFGYAAVGCFCTFITLGAIGHLAANQFMLRVYSNVKLD
ncbi:hypothetical protein BC828DRAFT_391526 [Blastocladiella britannica]|nr:hypothetical protein BC828DRAFT_391526 [Blastocladiella britannica]